MFGLFKNKSEEPLPDWYASLEESQERWFVFLDKMESKLEELCTAAIPELKEILETDDDIYKRTFHRVYAGIQGQLDHIREKARDTYEAKIVREYENLNDSVSVLSPHHELLTDFRTVCSGRYNVHFENQYDYWRNQIEKTQERDLELEYQKIVSEFESIKNKFSCKQCGGNITIEKIFFMETYLNCTYCQTQNTFEPGTQARNLQNFAKALAEQRTATLYEDFDKENRKERDFYHQKHELSLSTIHEKDKNVLAQKQKRMDELEQQRQEAIQNAPKLYHIYLRAMYDEWNKITPDLKEHNEKMYKNQLKSY